MKFRKILPAAAGVIALTSSVAFAHGMRGMQESQSLRIRISDSDSRSDSKENAGTFAIDSESGNVYHVRVEHGEHTKVVLVDARTGQVVRSM